MILHGPNSPNLCAHTALRALQRFAMSLEGKEHCRQFPHLLESEPRKVGRRNLHVGEDFTPGTNRAIRTESAWNSMSTSCIEESPVPDALNFNLR